MAAAPSTQKGDQNKDNVLKGATDAEIHAAVEALQPVEEEIEELKDSDVIAVPPPLPPRAGKREVKPPPPEAGGTITDTREKVTDVVDMDMHADVLIDEPTIEDGGTAETLKESLVTFEMPGGIQGAAATSLAGYKYEIDKRTNQPKNHNEDRLYINPKTGLVAVIDGMGGGTKGEHSAQSLAESISQNEDNIAEAANFVHSVLKNIPDAGLNDGACFLSGKIEVGQPIEVNQCGDVDLYHFSADGEIKYQPGDQLKLGQTAQSPMEQFEEFAAQGLSKDQILKRMEIDPGNLDKFPAVKDIVERIVAGERPFLERSNPLYENLRMSVLKSVTKKEADVATFQTESVVEEGDWIILMSDGVSDNFTQEQIVTFMGNVIKYGWSPAEATKKISDELQRRIELRAKEDPTAMKNYWKLDNATIVIMRVGKAVQKAA